MAHDRPTSVRVFANRAFLWLCLGCVTLVIAILAVLVASICLEGGSSLSWHFLTSKASSDAELAGIGPALAGSILVCIICGLTSLPIGIGTAIYLEEFAARSRFSRIVQTNILNLAGVPSVVYGLLGFTAFRRMFDLFDPQSPVEFGDPESLAYFALPFGKSVLSGGLTLMLVILPIVIIATQEALRAVPSSLRAGSLALGATPWQTTWGITLPAAVPGIMTGSILAMSRAIGESAPILIAGVALYINYFPENLMSEYAILPIQVYQWAGESRDEFHSLAATAIIVQLAALLILNGLAIFIRQKLQKPLP